MDREREVSRVFSVEIDRMEADISELEGLRRLLGERRFTRAKNNASHLVEAFREDASKSLERTADQNHVTYVLSPW